MKLKKRFLSLAFLLFALILASCGGGKQKEDHHHEGDLPHDHSETTLAEPKDESATDMHKQHKSLADNFAHKDIVILEQIYKLSDVTRIEMEEVIEAYFQLKNALFIEDEEAVNAAIDLMSEKVLKVKSANLADEGLKTWQNHKPMYESKLKEMRHITGLENKRSYFSHISEILYCTIKSFGLKHGRLFAAYCPSVFKNMGAFWITGTRIIQNPYMGAEMPTCGEIKEEL